MRMGLPKLVISDQGKEFRSEVDKETMKLLGIKRHFTTPYHPQVCLCFNIDLTSTIFQANGIDEQWNQTLKNMVIKYAHEKKEDWDMYLDSCVFAYNTSKHTSSLYTPFEVMFGRKAVLPVELTTLKEGNEVLEDYLTTSQFVSFSCYKF